MRHKWLLTLKVTMNYYESFDQKQTQILCYSLQRPQKQLLPLLTMSFNESLNIHIFIILHSTVHFYFPPSFHPLCCLIFLPPLRLWERSCIVGVCCLSARAKIDSKLQSLLRTPHCAAWPQNNTHRHILTDSHTNVKHAVCRPTSIFPVQPVDVTITQSLSQLCQPTAAQQSYAPAKETLSRIHRC